MNERMRSEEGLQSKLIGMYEARDAMLNSINLDLINVLDIDKFLQTVVTEVGKHLAVDRCNIITPSPEGGFRVNHEYLSDKNLMPGLGLNIPPSLVPTETIKKHLPDTRHFSIDDIRTANLPLWVRTTCQLIGTRAVLVAPLVFRGELLGVMGLHYCREPHQWTEAEIQLIEWIASQISIRLQYTRLYYEKEEEIERTKLLFETFNEISTRTNFTEITSFAIDRTLELLRADYGCFALLDAASEYLHFDLIRTRRGFDLRKIVDARYREAHTVLLSDHPLVRELLDKRQTIKLEDIELSNRLLSQVIKGRSALIAPITIRERALGIIVLVWVSEAVHFSDYEVQLLGSISSQIAIALEKNRLETEVIRFKRDLDDVRAGEQITLPSLHGQAASGQGIRVELTVPLTMEEVERVIITQTLSITGGDKAKAARLLGIGRKTLYRKLEQYRNTKS